MSVPYGTDISNLSPTITVSEGATLTPASGLARDFTTTVGYFHCLINLNVFLADKSVDSTLTI